jgi:hypothetical protein
MGFTGAIGVFFAITMLSVLPLVVLTLMIPYLTLRIRDAQSAERDPEIGFKALLWAFISLSVVILLTGATVIVVDLVVDAKQKQPAIFQPAPQAGPFGQQLPPPAPKKEDFPNTAQRTGGAIMAVGLIGILIHALVLVLMTNERRWPAARRAFIGWMLAFNGVIVMVDATSLLVLIVQKDFDEPNVINALLGVLLVWMPAWVVTFSFLRSFARQPYHRPTTSADEDEE